MSTIQENNQSTQDSNISQKPKVESSILQQVNFALSESSQSEDIQKKMENTEGNVIEDISKKKYGKHRRKCYRGHIKKS